MSAVSGNPAPVPEAQALTTSLSLSEKEPKQEPTIIRSLSIIDPILQFLTKATGQTLVPFGNLESTLPALPRVVPCEDFCRLVRFGILRVESLARGEEGIPQRNKTQPNEETPEHSTQMNELWEDVLTKHWGKNKKSSSSSPTFHVGFPSGDTNKKLCGSTKTAAKRRLAALKRSIKEEEKREQRSTKAKKSSNFRKIATPNNPNGNDGEDENHIGDAKHSTKSHDKDEEISPESGDEMMNRINKDWTLPLADDFDETNTEEPLLKTEQEAQKAFHDVLELFYDRGGNACDNSNQELSIRSNSTSRRGKKHSDDLYAQTQTQSSSFSPTPIINSILPRQLSYAGTQPAQTARYANCNEAHDIGDSDGETCANFLHPIIAKAFKLSVDSPKRNQEKYQRRLYRHQSLAIASALRDDRHTLVCTGTGSGKSLCFLVPVLQRALTMGQKSLLLFPTKALAQDQLVKLQGLLEANPELAEHVSAAAIDGDTPHSQRSLIAGTCNVVFTNPDTLHASILPNWKIKYKRFLTDLKYVVLDEAHMYEGVFGAHVAMILARLYRVHCVCARLPGDGGRGDENSVSSYSVGESDDISCPDECSQAHQQSSLISSQPSLVFLACSATLAHPKHHFRLLCCIPSAQPVTVLTEDFSPRAAKHFFVWNPPLLDENGKSLGYVICPKKKRSCKITKKKGINQENTNNLLACNLPVELSSAATDAEEKTRIQHRRREVRRRHSADETALLLAKAVTKGVRCIAFCKTRCLVEWVYERCLKVLKQSQITANLVSKVDSYRGGYSKLKRREIEEKLFHNQLLGVVGTSALELGVDIGGVGLTLHCGFPSSHASLMQQAGRAGRGAAASHEPSLAICVCFNSPIDQHLWRHPTSLLSRGLSAPLSMPIYPGLVQGHLIW